MENTTLQPSDEALQHEMAAEGNRVSMVEYQEDSSSRRAGVHRTSMPSQLCSEVMSTCICLGIMLSVLSGLMDMSSRTSLIALPPAGTWGN
jgi:hypothetical protein